MTPLTETQRLARDVDRRLAALPRERWGELVADAGVVLAAQWAGVTEDGKPACMDCGRTMAYSNHVCSCPTGKVRKRLGAMVQAAEIERMGRP